MPLLEAILQLNGISFLQLLNLLRSWICLASPISSQSSLINHSFDFFLPNRWVDFSCGHGSNKTNNFFHNSPHLNHSFPLCRGCQCQGDFGWEKRVELIMQVCVHNQFLTWIKWKSFSVIFS
jgi:hypothetical protein